MRPARLIPLAKHWEYSVPHKFDDFPLAAVEYGPAQRAYVSDLKEGRKI